MKMNQLNTNVKVCLHIGRVGLFSDRLGLKEKNVAMISILPVLKYITKHGGNDQPITVPALIYHDINEHS